ncbi:type VII toxin-antitoxin system MntA family adenylyltransferase antitoxin [Candidatus Leptofilum sp.]|uniref:type VII toxin-antitoxin system MntA family adenylyltransferase antitoxin n=1 Tax=Candidatus Leptofilum sp. TaxID=3241576 RepID=UPI003B5BD115
MNEQIVQTILTHYPHVQAVYLFGSYGTEDERPSSDVDIALLLLPEQAKAAGSLLLGELHLALAELLGKEVDLVNLRQVSTVFQKEIVMTGQQIFCADVYAADEFEMLTLSYYQKLNEERREILAAFKESGRAYDV